MRRGPALRRTCTGFKTCPHFSPALGRPQPGRPNGPDTWPPLGDCGAPHERDLAKTVASSICCPACPLSSPRGCFPPAEPVPPPTCSTPRS
ncbi:hypothetical protein BJY00DRAFT_287411 [Aspergillus carlsbadensis]|nr:hypothetical protein BJY00DRAFT_287411 [Aspergillus carlsbadensis]